MKRFLHRHILLPAFETGIKRRRTFRYWRDLERTQWLPAEEIGAIQFRALQRLLVHAYDRCPYYRDEWDRRGLDPRALQSAEDFHRWPVLERETVRERRDAMRAAGPPMRLISKATGGSSGVPLQFDLDHDSHDRRTAAWHRGYGWAGAAPGTRQLYLWGAPLQRRGVRGEVKDRLYRRLYRQRLISCFDNGDTLAGRFARATDRVRPDVIVGYTGPLYEVARRLEETGAAPAFAPRAIVVGAERLHTFQRALIERVFRAPVFETYGSREFMLIGSECERHEGLHLTAENLYVEVLGEDGRPVAPGAEGDIVVTDLYNYGMPFVRYATGDRGVAGTGACPCGRGLPLLKAVVGRRLDMVIASGGRLIPGEFFPHLMKDFPSVRRFQVIQEHEGLVRIALVANRMSEADRSALEALVRDALGPDVLAEFERVDDIPLTAAGKLRVVVRRSPLRGAA